MRDELSRLGRQLVRRPLLHVITIGILSAVACLAEIGLALHWRVLHASFGVTDPSGVVSFLGLPFETDLAPALKRIRDTGGAFSDVSAYLEGPVNVIAAGEAAELHGVQAADRFFAVLGATPECGRWPVGGLDSHEVVISADVWRRFYGRRQSAVGEQLSVNGRELTIVAVAGRLDYPLQAAIWVPVGVGTDTMLGDSLFIWGLGRLTPGASLADAAATLSRAGLSGEPGVERIGSNMRSQVRPVVHLLIGTFLLILVLALATVTFLRTAHVIDTYREIQTKISLGATSYQLAADHVGQLTILGVGGGAIGVLAGEIVWRSAIAWVPPSVPAPLSVGGSAALGGFAAALATGLCGGFFSLAGRLDREERLTPGWGGTTTVGRAGHAVFSVLVVIQVGVAMCLAGVGAQLVASAVQRSRLDRGFVPGNVAVSEVVLARYRYRNGAARLQFYDQLLGSLAAQPAMRRVAAVSAPPYSMRATAILPIRLDTSESPAVRGIVRAVTPGYFDVMGARLIEGRDFANTDTAGTPLVAIVSESISRRLALGNKVLGSRLRVPGSSPNVEVVGVVRDLLDPVEAATGASGVYVPLRQRPRGSMAVVARTRLDPGSAAAVVRTLVRDIDPEQPVSRSGSLESMIDQSLSRERLATLSIALLAWVAIVVAAAGLFASTSRAMRERLPELGVRAALGARPASLAGRFIGIGCRPVMLGLGLGWVASAWASSLVRHSWPGLIESDPWSIATVALLLAATGVTSVAVPVWVAVRLSPAAVLRMGG